MQTETPSPVEIGGYLVVGQIGRGGMGSVFLAQQRSLKRYVALKILHRDLAQNDRLQSRFMTEGQALSLLGYHPGIVQVHDFFEINGQLVLVMEYVKGHSLERIISRETGPIPYERALRLFDQILDAIGFAHSRGIIHRDMKPSNVLVNTEDRTKISDFGIARIAGNKRMTMTGARLGTIFYMAPEQLSDNICDERTDMYALGMTLYEMLAGRLPFSQDTTSEFDLMEMITSADMPDPRVFYPDIPDWLVALVMRSVEKSPEARFQSSEEFAAAIREGISAQKIKEQTIAMETVTAKKRKKWR